MFDDETLHVSTLQIVINRPSLTADEYMLPFVRNVDCLDIRRSFTDDWQLPSSFFETVSYMRSFRLFAGDQADLEDAILEKWNFENLVIRPNSKLTPNGIRNAIIHLLKNGKLAHKFDFRVNWSANAEATLLNGLNISQVNSCRFEVFGSDKKIIDLRIISERDGHAQILADVVQE